MNTLEDQRPVKSLEEVWGQYRAWAVTSGKLKKTQDTAQITAVALGILGAALATLAGKIEDWNPAIDASPGATLLAVSSAAALALAGYIGRELLAPDKEPAWSRCRRLAEALKREVWRGLMRTPPYDGEGAAGTLLERASSLIRNTGLQKLRPSESDIETRPLPKAVDVGDYIAERVRGQIDYYEDQSGKHQKKLRKLQRLTLALGATAVLLGLGGVRNTDLPLLVPVVTVISAAVIALVQSSRVKSLIPLYQETAVQLRFALARWQDGAGIRERWTERGEQAPIDQASYDFIAKCEEIMARENECWRAEWISEEPDESLNAFLSQASAPASPSPPGHGAADQDGA